MTQKNIDDKDEKSKCSFIRKISESIWIQKISEFFKKKPITWLSTKFANFCGEQQMLAFIIAFGFFIVFSAFVVTKDFFGAKTCEGLVNTASFFVDFATLPLVVFTLMFTAHGAYGDSQLLKVINMIKDDVEKLETGVAERELEHSPDADPLYAKDLKKRDLSSEELKQDVMSDSNDSK